MDIWNAFTRALKVSHRSNMQAAGTSEMPPEPSKNDDLLAFRTIIKMLSMLSLIQSPARLATNAPIGTTQEDRRSLRLLDALSAVLIRRHEITAVVARPYDGSTGNLRVYASVVLPGKTEPFLQPSETSDVPNFWDRARNFAVAANPRDTKINGNSDSLMNFKSLPIIGDYEKDIAKELVDAAKVEGNAQPLLDTFLKNHW